MRTRILSFLLCALFGAFLAGCLESNEQFTLNPDGRGKVVVEATITSMASLFDAESDKKRNTKEEVKEFVQEMMQNSVGIDAWKDITCKAVGDDKIVFTGTAYFSDISRLNIHQISSSTFVREDVPGGGWVLRLKNDREENEEPTEPENLTEEEIAIRVDSLRTQYEMGRSMIGPVLEQIRQRFVFTFPGTVTEATSFTRTPKGAYALEINGDRMLAVMDSLVAADSFWRDQVISGKPSSTDRQQEMAMRMFGEGGIPMLKVNGGKDLFKYDAEVAAALKKRSAMLKKFGLRASDIES